MLLNTFTLAWGPAVSSTTPVTIPPGLADGSASAICAELADAPRTEVDAALHSFTGPRRGLIREENQRR